MLPHEELIKQAEKYISDLYQSNAERRTAFYTLERLLNLKEEVKTQCEEANVSGTMTLELATLFSYIPHWNFLEHQDVGKHLKDFSADLNQALPMEKIVELVDSIQEHEAKKTDLEEQIIYDASYAYLGKKKLKRNLSLLGRDEKEDMAKDELFQTKLAFILKFYFRTKYAIDKYEAQRAKNIYSLQSEIDKRISKKKKLKLKERKLGRGIETVYRATYRNHINLSSIADAKANLIISVNTIILSVIITLAGTGYTFFETGFFKYARFTVPIIILLLSSLTAVIFAVLSASPEVTKKDVSKKRLMGKKSSILFFGNFTAIEQNEFVREMSIFQQNDNMLYDSMSVDLYQLGKVLRRKYYLVKIAYNIFIIGLALSVLSFVGIFIYSQVYTPISG